MMLSSLNSWRDNSNNWFLPFLNTGDFGITKNNWNLIITAIVDKVYNERPLQPIIHEFEKFSWQNQNSFRRNRHTASQILINRSIIERVRANNLEVTLSFVDFSKPFIFIKRKNGANASSI